ncbi:MAG TPA: ABC transporter ATP-binding protein [Thiomicrospira sp.]|jgi:putative ABC transport system ATP-binding protein|nr:ABC transporter ATP-binding protein [Thiomicrospira sp.]
MTHQPIVQCHKISKTYGQGDNKTFALRETNLTVYEQELLMIVGPSGCGKTTLLSIISNLIEADSGQCEILGTEVLNLSDSQKTAFRGQHIGFVFQSFNLFPALTALENVASPLIIQGIKYEQALKKARPYLESVGIAEQADHIPSKLSGGQQQRVAIARALVNEPELIICDEPTSALDHESGQTVMQLLKSIAEEKKTTLVVVTHDNRIFSYADRIVEMDDGRIIGTKHNEII